MATVTWTIVKMEKNRHNQNADNDPEALYMMNLQRAGSEWITGTGTEYSNVQRLMKHFQVESPSDLVGKTFESEFTEADHAFELFILQISTNGEYTPPFKTQVRDIAAAAMANMAEPEFGRIDSRTIAQAFQEVWGNGFEADPEWLAEFADQISAFSGGTVQLTAADSDDFRFRVKGPASYMKLVKGDQFKLVVIGPYSSPVTFD